MENLLAAFDLRTEGYRLFPEPNYFEERVHVTMRVLGESLCVVCNYYVSFYIDIWVMKEYAVKESWTKLFRVAVSDVRLQEYVTPLAYSKSGREVFMVQNYTVPLWYDIEQRTIRDEFLSEGFKLCFNPLRLIAMRWWSKLLLHPTMSDIPREIVAEFLSRVPAQPLLRLRCVSKSWREIIDSPDFIKLHLNRALQTNSDRKLILRSTFVYVADFDELEQTNTAVYTALDLPYKRSAFGTDILGSCHGLLCLDTTGDEDRMVLWNPTTHKYHRFPYPEFENLGESAICIWCLVFGFGYDKVSDDYKVLRIFQSHECQSEAKVYSLKSNSWRKIPCFPYCLKYKRANGVLVAGALHWAVCRTPQLYMENLIGAFDLGTEEYRLVPEPNYSEGALYVTVGVLGESLCVVCNYYDSSYVDIWVMKSYGVKESWTKLFTVAESDLSGKPLEFVTPLAFSKSGREVFMVVNGKQPLWYDIEQRKIRDSAFRIDSVPAIMVHQMCFGSLVRTDGGVGRVVDVTEGEGSGGSNGRNHKKRDEFLSEGFRLIL